MARVERFRARPTEHAILATFLAVALVGPGAPRILAASPRPPTLAVNPTSGPPGLPVAISGSGYAAGTTYGLCILPAGKTKCGYEGANLIGGAPAEHFTAASDGTVPTGTTGIIPDLPAGAYRIVSTAPGTGAIVAGSDFSVTAPTFGVDPATGPGGATATLAITGGAPTTAYTVCMTTSGLSGCGGTGIVLGNVTTDTTGALGAGTTVHVPGLATGSYEIGIYLANANDVFLASQSFAETAPTLSLSASSGAAGSMVTVSGTGYAAGASYQLCLVPAGATQCGGVGVDLVVFQADASGAIPANTTATMPAVPPASYDVVVLVASSTPWALVSQPYELGAGIATNPAPSLTPAATVAAAPALATVAPLASAAPTGSETGAGLGLPLVLIVILVLVVLAVAFWLSRRRRREDDWPPAG
jgi:hypothetical protein